VAVQKIVLNLLQVGSLALTALIVCTILASFPLALAIYAVVLGIRWIGVLHFLGIFIILGIGVDDVFVVLDHWKVSSMSLGVAMGGDVCLQWGRGVTVLLAVIA
jgi:hypothetical protein